jgi:hypothetical protein
MQNLKLGEKGGGRGVAKKRGREGRRERRAVGPEERARGRALAGRGERIG